jgi:hypothetical protein
MADGDLGDELDFIQVRTGTDQWVVKFRDHYIARVTERVIATPPYVVSLPRGDGEMEVYLRHRDQVVELLVREVRERGLVSPDP